MDGQACAAHFLCVISFNPSCTPMTGHITNPSKRCGNCTQGYRATMWQAQSLNPAGSRGSDLLFPAWQIQHFKALV